MQRSDADDDDGCLTRAERLQDAEDELFGDFHGDNAQLMAMAAHRYCLGRMSYIPTCCAEWLTARRKWLDDNTRRNIVRDTVSAIVHRPFGPLAYAREWQDVAQLLYGEMGEKDRAWVRDAVRHHGQPFPLKEPNTEGPTA